MKLYCQPLLNHTKNLFLSTGFLLVLSNCASNSQQSLYDEMGGQPVIETLVDHFILEIANDNRVLPRFMDSNVNRFREKMIEHMCVLADGPCVYTGDDMVRVHAGMDINSAEFYAIVENLISAMDKTGIALGPQNQMLERMAPLRTEVIGI
ncbi:group 1 truncated hemoglobin [Gammaproteobacteria bacterium LSUCC0112]|nr:group 1 truncated hemoglobin [Gammaproteobacteria bacterium LSUCC0112]